MIGFILTLLFFFPPIPVSAKSKSPMREFPFILQFNLSITIVFTKSNRYEQVIAYPERFTECTGLINSMKSNRNKEDIVASQIVITKTCGGSRF